MDIYLLSLHWKYNENVFKQSLNATFMIELSSWEVTYFVMFVWF